MESLSLRLIHGVSTIARVLEQFCDKAFALSRRTLELSYYSLQLLSCFNMYMYVGTYV